ncbi:hypothetical protein JCM19046_4575 [Bacillus sp. JCM 19046]|nr:hypothetical protein JCM19046_4575 [Bacillus sp. JCM 19046]
MTAEQMAEALAKALEPVNKRLDDIEKNNHEDDSSEAKTDEEKLAAALAKAVEPINKRLDAIEKVRDSSKQQQTDNQTTSISKSQDYLQYFGTN